MSDPLALVGTTVGDYQIQRKKRSVDPYALFFEAIHTTERETYWFAVYPPSLLAIDGVKDSIEAELSAMQQVPHDFWVAPKEVMFDPDSGYLFLLYQPYPRSRTIRELSDKLRPPQARKVFYFLADLLQAAHDFGFSGNVDPRQIYVRRQNDDVELRWYHTPVNYHALLPEDTPSTDLNEWYSYLSPEQLVGVEATPHSDFFVMGTILFEVITGKRAFFHNLPDKARTLVLSGTSKTIERARLTPEQRQLIESLHIIEPSERLANVRKFQSAVRELFQDPSQMNALREFPVTSEHPALYVKEGEPSVEFAVSPSPQRSQEETSASVSREAIQEVSSTPVTSRKVEPPQEQEDPLNGPEVRHVTPKEKSEPEENKQESTSIELMRRGNSDLTSMSVVKTFKQMNLGKVHELSVRIESQKAKPWDPNSIPDISPFLRVVPVLPGCMVSPQEAVLDVRNPKVQTEFWVVPLAPVNRVDAAVIQIWHAGIPKDSIPIPCNVRSQAPTWVAGVASTLSFLIGFFFTMFGPKANVVTQSDSSLVSHVYQQSITVFAQYGFWFGFFFLFAAGLSYYLLRPQTNPTIHYVLSDKIPSTATLSFNNDDSNV
ncbi:MAG: hypothetical protein EP343_15415 [Deltaproteobacteria bacterium]|nr:MAG: hypothetical protein EP343_15415 [Deltaproteobacteria bacterium]